MKILIIDAFKDLKSKQHINLNPNKKNALITFISYNPEITTIVVTREKNK